MVSEEGKMKTTVWTSVLGAVAFGMATSSALADGVVNIYTYRQPELIQPVLDAFTAETGIKTEVRQLRIS